uniref:Transporter n=1 Tax=Steinernema glaseri TaxID=37863 RepID=A0A1I8AN94_9BILA
MLLADAVHGFPLQLPAQERSLVLGINGQPGPKCGLAAGIVLMFGIVLFEQPAQGLLINVLHMLVLRHTNQPDAAQPRPPD